MSRPDLTLIVAHDQARLIGADGDLPWRLPNDLQRFKALTLGGTVVMGRKTWESLPRRPLPGRDNRLLSRDAGYVAEGATVFTDLELAFMQPQGRCFVIGGAQIYAHCLPLAAQLEITLVHTVAAGDQYFPPYDVADFDLVHREDHLADDRHAHDYSFLSYRRRADAAR